VPPEESVIAPDTLPYVDCADSCGAKTPARQKQAAIAKTTTTVKRRLFIFSAPQVSIR
jgi:hypothetical protein